MPEHQVPLTSPQTVGTFMGSSALRNQTRWAPVHSNPILSEILAEILSTSFFHILFYIHLSSIFFPRSQRNRSLCASVPLAFQAALQNLSSSQSSLRVLCLSQFHVFGRGWLRPGLRSRALDRCWDRQRGSPKMWGWNWMLTQVGIHIILFDSMSCWCTTSLLLGQC